VHSVFFELPEMSVVWNGGQDPNRFVRIYDSESGRELWEGLAEPIEQLQVFLDPTGSWKCSVASNHSEEGSRNIEIGRLAPFCFVPKRSGGDYGVSRNSITSTGLVVLYDASSSSGLILRP